MFATFSAVSSSSVPPAVIGDPALALPTGPHAPRATEPATPFGAETPVGLPAAFASFLDSAATVAPRNALATAPVDASISDEGSEFYAPPAPADSAAPLIAAPAQRVPSTATPPRTSAAFAAPRRSPIESPAVVPDKAEQPARAELDEEPAALAPARPPVENPAAAPLPIPQAAAPLQSLPSQSLPPPTSLLPVIAPPQVPAPETTSAGEDPVPASEATFAHPAAARASADSKPADLVSLPSAARRFSLPTKAKAETPAALSVAPALARPAQAAPAPLDVTRAAVPEGFYATATTTTSAPSTITATGTSPAAVTAPRPERPEGAAVPVAPGQHASIPAADPATPTAIGANPSLPTSTRVPAPAHAPAPVATSVPALKAPLAAPAQISSAPATALSEPRDNRVPGNKNRSQVSANKSDADSLTVVGTGRAYEQAAMTPNPAFAATPTSAPARSVGDAAPVAPTAAAKLIERVAEVAEHARSRPSEPISVRIDLDDTHRVDVRVSVRGGRVHADFRSDSPEVRAALSAAWNEFTRSREGADQRWAEPVFAALGVTPTSPAPAVLAASASPEARADAAQSGPGHDSPRQQAGDHDASRWSGAAASHRGRQAGAPASSPAPEPAAARPETSRHLSVLA